MMLTSSSLSLLEQNNSLIFKENNAILLNHLKQLWLKTKPLAGVKILHNIPLTHETLVKLESLLAAGAELTVTQVKFVRNQPDPDIIALLDQIGVRYVAEHEAVEGDFDLALDCCAEVMNMSKVRISKGIVELTQSGGEQFKK